MDKLGDIDLFVRVVKNGGLAAAGREVGLSPASMSARMNRMEDHYDIRLLHRSTRHVSPTEAGLRFYENSLRILAEVRDAEEQLHLGQESFSGPLRITAPSDVGQQHIAAVLSKFIFKYPDITPYLNLTDGVINLSEGGFDLGIRYGLLPDSNLVARKLANSHRVLCASPKYLKRMGTPNTPQDLHKHDCLVMIRNIEPLTTWNFQTIDGHEAVTIDAARQCNDGAQIRRWALDGAGIALKSYIDVVQDIKAGRLVTVLDDYLHDFEKKSTSCGANLQVVYTSRQHVPKRVKALVDELLTYFNELCR